MARSLTTTAVFLSLTGILSPAGALQTNRRVVNPDTDSSDSKPALSVLGDGTVWMAWHAYFKPSCDRVLARQVGLGELGPVQQVSGEGKVHDAPVMVATRDGGAWVFWSALRDGVWRLVGRRLEQGHWAPP